MLAVCSKEASQDTTFIADQLRQTAGNGALQTEADKYLADLKAKAQIVYELDAARAPIAISMGEPAGHRAGPDPAALRRAREASRCRPSSSSATWRSSPRAPAGSASTINFAATSVGRAANAVPGRRCRCCISMGSCPTSRARPARSRARW